jgi:hypothetical protein
MTVVVIGYESSEDTNVRLRARRPIDENFFLGEWGNGFTSHLKE